MSRSVSAPSSVTKTSPCWNGLIVPGSTLRYGSNFIRWTRRPRASSRQPIDAAAKPLPKDDTTPPVTKMYFADIAATSFDGWFWLCSVCTIKYIAGAVEMSSGEVYAAAMGLNSFTLALESRAYTALRSFADRKSLKPPHLLTGERGEDAAYFHLRGLGYTVVARRWRTERLAGDLDLVAWDGPTLVIFEIKTRTA